MTPHQRNLLLTLSRSILTPPSRDPVSVWCERHLVIPPPQTQSPGQLSWMTREYIREPLDSWGVPGVTDLVLCFGSQTGKTTMIQGGVSWVVCEDPAGVLWVMPNADLARSFSETRWVPLVRASPDLAKRIPSGSQRHAFKTMQQRLGGSVVNFIGSNSPANLASRPARVVVLDEVDKFPQETRGEADAVNLAEQRTKAFAAPRRIKCSTPTTIDGLIWQEFLKGDMRRYHLPCPACHKLFVLGWSQPYTILPRLGCEAWVVWDKAAKRPDGSWDLDRVAATAHVECPHCHGHILEGDKTRLVRAGVWRPTATAARGFRSYHLSSLYAAGTQTSFGALAVAFLQAKKSLLGLQGFINGALAEPFENQDTRGERIELVTPRDAEPLAESVNIMAVDCQVVGAKFWWVVRAWAPAGHSRLVANGTCDEWEQLRSIQIEHQVEDNHVCVDSGNDAATVYEQCLRWGKLVPSGHGGALHVGWTPSKGREREAAWRDVKTKQPRPYFLSSAALPHHRFRLPLLEFNGDYLLDVLAELRKPNNSAGFRWEVSGTTGDEYWRHLDAKVRKSIVTSRTGKVQTFWCKRGERWPDHLLDCEIMQLAMAMLHRRLPWAALVGAKP